MPILLKSFLLSLILFTTADAKIFSPVVALNDSTVDASDTAYTNQKGGMGFGTGVVIHWDAAYDNLYYRYGALLERRKFYFDNDSKRKRYDHLTAGVQAGLSYNVLEIFWPFIGVSAGWSAKDLCTYQDQECGKDKFDPLWAGSQVGIALGAAENVKFELVIENQLLEVDKRWDKYQTVSVLFHFYPDEN